MAAKKKAAKKKAAKVNLPCAKPTTVAKLRDCIREWTVELEEWGNQVKAECDRMERQCCKHPVPGPSHIDPPPPPPW